MEQKFTQREIEHYFSDMRDDVKEIKAQTIRTNGRVTRLEKIMLILITATLVLLITNGSSLVGFIKTLLI